MHSLLGDLRGALHSVWNRRWLALAVAWGVCIAGWMVVAIIPNSYESRARIFVELDDVLSKQLDIAGSGKQDIEKVRQTLVSAVNLEKVVRATQLGERVETEREMQAAVEMLTRSVTVTSKEDNLFEVSAAIGKSNLSDAENAALAQDVVQKLIDIFREHNVAGSRGQVDDTIAFLDQQLGDRKRELEEAEQKRVAFEAAHPDLVGGTTSISTRIQSMRSEMRGIDADIAAAQSALAAINGQIGSTPRTLPGGDGYGGGAQGALAQAEAQLTGMRARGLTDSHPDVQAQKRQVEALRRQAASQPGGGGMPNPAYSSLISIKAERQANVQALEARKAALQSDITGMMGSQAEEPAVAAEATRISRDYDVLKDKYDELLKNREEMRLRGQVESETSALRFDVVDPPSSPRRPAAPNRVLLLVGVLVLGCAAGAGVAYGAAQLRSSFTTADKLEQALDLPVIGTVSRSMTAAARALEATRRKQFIAASAALAAVCALLITVEMIQVGSVA